MPLSYGLGREEPHAVSGSHGGILIARAGFGHFSEPKVSAATARPILRSEFGGSVNPAHDRDRWLAAIAARQFGLFTRDQALPLGYSADGIVLLFWTCC
jgi:hypothetical protein